MQVTVLVGKAFDDETFATEMWKGTRKLTAYVKVDDTVLLVEDDGTITETPDLEKAMDWLDDNK